MISLTARTQSVALAFAMIISSSSSSCVSFSNPFAGMSSYFTLNKETVVAWAIIAAVAGKVRLDTKPRGTYSYSNWQDDIMTLLSSYNILDAESRAAIFNFVDKYFVGSKFKKDEYTIRTKEADGSVVAVKRNKVTQLPSGVMGLLDAYVFQQLKANNELLPAAAAMYVFMADPQGVWKKAVEKVQA